jgi:hypothetical protein
MVKCAHRIAARPPAPGQDLTPGALFPPGLLPRGLAATFRRPFEVLPTMVPANADVLGPSAPLRAPWRRHLASRPLRPLLPPATPHPRFDKPERTCYNIPVTPGPPWLSPGPRPPGRTKLWTTHTRTTPHPSPAAQQDLTFVSGKKHRHPAAETNIPCLPKNSRQK